MKDCGGIESNDIIKNESNKKGLLFSLFFNEFDCFKEKGNKSENAVIGFLKKMILFKNYESQKDILAMAKNNINAAKVQEEKIQSKTLICCLSFKIKFYHLIN